MEKKSIFYWVYRIVSPGGDDIGQIGTGMKEEVVAPFFKGNVQTVIFDIYPERHHCYHHHLWCVYVMHLVVLSKSSCLPGFFQRVASKSRARQQPVAHAVAL